MGPLRRALRRVDSFWRVVRTNRHRALTAPVALIAGCMLLAVPVHAAELRGLKGGLYLMA
jgi:hypothetical protein